MTSKGLRRVSWPSTLGLNPQPTFYVESVCSSSSSGLRKRYALIASGLHDVVLVLGFQKMSEISSAESQERMGTWSGYSMGGPFRNNDARVLRNVRPGTLREVRHDRRRSGPYSGQSSTYGQINEKAVFRKSLTLDKVLEPKYIATPLKMYDCCANADGSSCVILSCRKKRRRPSAKNPSG